MSFLVRTVRGNSDVALRQATKLLGADTRARLAAMRRYNEKPCQRRRRLRSTAIRSSEKNSLLSNLRVVFSRKARGF